MLGLGGRKHTWLDDIGELLADGEKQDLLPCLLALLLWHAEGPRSAFYVARILPYGLDTALEEMDGVFHLQRVEREAVVCLPEGLERDDVLEQDGQAAFVGGARRVLVVVEGPGVLEGRRAHASEHVQPGGIPLRRG